MFTQTASYYDRIYSGKRYGAEAERLRQIIRENLCSPGYRLLDVGCGTGRHLEYLRQHFEAEGLDIDPLLLEIAHQRNPGMPLHQGDMTGFHLDHRFDVVTCLFSSIGYVRTLGDLSRAVNCMAEHLVPGGLLLVEPWFTPDEWRPNTVSGVFVDEPDLKIARISNSFVEGRLSILDFHYLIGTPNGTEHVVERHELGLFHRHEMQGALEEAGLETWHDMEGLTGRGLFVATKPGHRTID